MGVTIVMVLGALFGLFIAFTIAFFATITWVKNSNDLGDSQGTYDEFTGTRMKFISVRK